ncbi:hypothetical protein LG3211_2213 [Lysobacter gummosus]|nr:hypothetical protein LG3211_2213 [Lysobacter gummosus]
MPARFHDLSASSSLQRHRGPAYAGPSLLRRALRAAAGLRLNSRQPARIRPRGAQRRSDR